MGIPQQEEEEEEATCMYLAGGGCGRRVDRLDFELALVLEVRSAKMLEKFAAAENYLAAVTLEIAVSL